MSRLPTASNTRWQRTTFRLATGCAPQDRERQWRVRREREETHCGRGRRHKATALRCSEVLALRWADILWDERKIRIVKSRKKTGVDGDTKTPASERNAPMGRVLAHYLREWHKQTPYAKPTDFVFPSIKESGRVPISRRCFAPTICALRRERRAFPSPMGIAGVSTTCDTACRTG